MTMTKTKADKEDCANGIDDDGDFFVDCEEPTCSEDEHCKGNSDKPEDPKPAEKEICDNTIDDDGNSLADCKDPACAEGEHCKGNGDGGNSDKPEDPEQSTDPDDSNGDKPADPEQNTDSEEDADSASGSCSATPQSQSRGSFAWVLLLLCGGFAALRRRIKAHKT